VKHFRALVRIWLLALIVCAVAVAFSFKHMDVPIALHVWQGGRFLNSLNTAFGAGVILSLESAVALGLILTRVARGHLSPFEEALAIACLASICSYGINGEVLKPLFGVPTPAEVMDGARHSLNFLQGSGGSSFPSGHMVLAGAFAGVFMSLYRASVWLLSALLVLAAGLLVVGGWHFLSDVIAGTFAGVSAGILAGEAWTVHARLGKV
jgi:membrane-associated phospholipid phosphatase